MPIRRGARVQPASRARASIAMGRDLEALGYPACERARHASSRNSFTQGGNCAQRHGRSSARGRRAARNQLPERELEMSPEMPPHKPPLCVPN